MVPPISVSVGDRYERLVVVQVEDCPRKYGDPAKRRPGQRTVKVQCDCGSPAYFLTLNSLRQGNTRSCGCLRRETVGDWNREAKRSHGLRKHPLYATWAGMRARCDNPANPNWPKYGGRGIQVHPAWQDAAVFIRDVEAEIGPRPPGMSLDRKDNNGGYEPGNVQWATPRAQALNRRTVAGLAAQVRDLEEENARLRAEVVRLRG